MSHLVDLEAERDRALQADQSPTPEVTQRPTAETASAGGAGAQLLRLRARSREADGALPLRSLSVTITCGTFYKPFSSRLKKRLAALALAVPARGYRAKRRLDTTARPR
jgi:hypothetical protein